MNQISNYIAFLPVLLLSLLLISSNALKLKGQCPILIPSSETTTSPIFLSNKKRPGLQVIAHRGSSFSLPEHTIAAYRLALELGADYIEPDIVSTKDGKLVAVHAVDLNVTTNVASIFPDRNSTLVTNEGKNITTGYFVYDFTYAEIRTLRVRQRLEDERRSKQFDYLFAIPTLREIFDLLYEWNTLIHPMQNETRNSGVYIEIKSPEIHLDQGIDLVELLLLELEEFPHSNSLFFGNSLHDSLSTGDQKIPRKNHTVTTFGCENQNSYQVPTLVIQCFHEPTIRKTFDAFESKSYPAPPFIYLVSHRCHSESFWYEVGKLNTLVSGVGPNKNCLLGESGYEFMIQAKKHRLAVHPWTTREEVDYLEPQFSTAEEELRYLYCHVGIHGIFTENVDLGVRVGMRGCDDFEAPIDLWNKIREYGKLKGMNETLESDVCAENNDADWLFYFSALMFGVAIGMGGFFIVVKLKTDIIKNRGERGGHQRITQNENANPNLNPIA